MFITIIPFIIKSRNRRAQGSAKKAGENQGNFNAFDNENNNMYDVGGEEIVERMKERFNRNKDSNESC